MEFYPASPAARDRFILDRRSPRPIHDAWRHQGLIVEDERTADGQIARAATVFLTGRECPWRCTMCDLWQYTTGDEDTPRGAIPAQVGAAREELRGQSTPITQLKLYNAGSFFDPRAVPEHDYDAVAMELAGLMRVVVESHPALVGPRIDRLDRWLEAVDRHCRSAPAIQLEVAMGLETVHPEALDRLNKRMTVDEFAFAAEQLRRRGASVRAFLLISPPFVPAEQQDDWLQRSIDVAFSCGASVVSLIPSRSGNGALEALAAEGAFREPRLEDIERGLESALAVQPDRGRIFVDLWDLQRCSPCPHCFEARRARLHAINLEQRLFPRPSCTVCGLGAAS
jgi:archaeosine synthase beta-subunit